MLGVAVLGCSFLYFYYLYTPKVSEPALEGVYSRSSLLVDDRAREFGVYKPAKLAAKAPVIFVLHGSGRSGAAMRNATGFEFDVLADERGFLVIYPEGYERHWNDCRASADYAANIENVDDISFFEKILDELETQHALNRDQVFATGLSNGGHMAFKLALEVPEQFAAIAAIAANLPISENSDCSPAHQPISVAIFNGTKDPINPYEGGLVEILGNSSRGAVLSSIETAQYWVEVASLSAFSYP